VADIDVQLWEHASGSGAVCRKILAALPEWFGIEKAVEHYVEVAERSPTLIASLDGHDVGLMTVLSHSSYAAEVYLMAVLPAYHRRGPGRLFLGRAEDSLARAGVEFLQVKTLSPSHPSEAYEKTRAFYLSLGFRPLEEFPELWGAENPALQMIKSIEHPDDA